MTVKHRSVEQLQVTNLTRYAELVSYEEHGHELSSLLIDPAVNTRC